MSARRAGCIQPTRNSIEQQPTRGNISIAQVHSPTMRRFFLKPEALDVHPNLPLIDGDGHSKLWALAAIHVLLPNRRSQAGEREDRVPMDDLDDPHHPLLIVREPEPRAVALEGVPGTTPTRDTALHA
eukprot:10272272-Alexandrium_andersonii.AAC.1